MGSSYPPGVTGNEPAITGEIEFDPHAPFWAGELNPGTDEGWGVFFRNEEDPMFIPPGRGQLWGKTEAMFFAGRANARYALRDEQPRSSDGLCLVCHDFHGDPTEGKDQ